MEAVFGKSVTNVALKKQKSYAESRFGKIGKSKDSDDSFGEDEEDDDFMKKANL